MLATNSEPSRSSAYLAEACLSPEKRTAALRMKGGSSRFFDSRLAYGRMLPDFDLTNAMSPALMVPLAVTSLRKLVVVTGWPDCALV